LSFQGTRLQETTNNYFDKIDKQDPSSLILSMAAFDTPINDEK